MAININNENKKALAEQIKAKLNSPDYVAMSDLITYDDRYGDMLSWILDKKDWKGNWINGTDLNPSKGNKHKSEHIVYGNELEKDDWEEIVNLIEKRNKEKEQIFETKKNNIKQKLNQQSNLYYYWGAGWRKRERNENADVWVEDKGMRGFTTLLGGHGNGLTYHLYIAENHPVLDNFPFQTGFYSIETDRPIEKRVGRYNGYSSTGGESNPFNFTKFVEVGDQITITPHEITSKEIEKPENSEEIKNDSNEVINYGNSNSENNKSLTKFSDKAIDSQISNYLLAYFQANDIKEIRVENGDLVVEYNKNTSLSEQKQNNNSQELQLAKNIIQKRNNQKLNKEELSKWVNNTRTIPTNSPSNNNNNNALWLGVGGILVLIIGMMAGLLLSKKDKKH